jgi:cysteine desulfurase
MHGRPTDIYLDANATTPTLPAAVQAACCAMQEQFGNPSSTHCAGLRARAMMEATRQNARRVIGAAEGRILFTSGATEAIQTAVLSAISAHVERGVAGSPRNLLLYGATEHKAVPEALRHWNHILHAGCEVMAIPVDQRGRHDLEFLAAHAGRAVLVCTMAVNNETGTISDLEGIEAIMRQHPDTLWLVDGVQALGKQALDLATSRVDYFPLSGHKLYAPKGIGLLYVREGAPFTPLNAGGGQESGQRSGTENMAGIAGFGVVFAELAEPTGMFCPIESLYAQRERLLAALREVFPGIVFNTPFEVAVPTTINFSVPGFASKELLDLFDAAGIRVSSGSACGAGKSTRSYVLDAMGLPAWRSESAVRLSFGRAWSDADCDAACARIIEAGHALRDACLLSEASTHRNEFDGVLQLTHDGACTWLIVERASSQCLIIDPLAELAERIERFIRCQDLRVVAVLDTHSHADHASARAALCTELSDHWAQPATAVDELGWPQGQGDQIEFGHYRLQRLALPGHTADSTAYVLFDRDQGARPRQVFVGDTVLMGGIGRSNFDSSSAADMFHSLRQLAATVGTRSLLCPAHDYNNEFATTLAAEAAHNPLLAGVLATTPISEDSFVDAKRSLDAGLDDSRGGVMMCGAVSTNTPNAHPGASEFDPAQLRQYLNEHPEAILVDVREAYEGAMGTLEPLPEVHAHGVPLSRLADAIPQWLAHPDQPLVFFCRSGNRSQLATRCLRRLGHPRAYHLRGGLALFA